MSWNEATPVGDDLVRALSRCIDACHASELHCTMAMDVVTTLHDDEHRSYVGSVLRACASLCAGTASSISALREPDLEAVADVLFECHVACRAACAECRRRPSDPCCMGCAEACGECAMLCELLLAGTALAAA